ncbi:unnamed protein product [Lepeophtheirus salmonis]|uniref:(salmon louse) hypothetical protein n=1 Tax=Lepeophtheirus salmonis TaxID=72036 RepID=A0A7R8H0F7_LEPSM|nr:unnamed protein product [Lepeophtheirus salmonis]CAF2767758.1 unnamed protein product [Lepeophtheirus salmonis]
MTSKVEEEEEENIRRLRESLTHFFLRDVKKWYELIFDLIKLFVLSVVLYHFGVERYRVTSYYTFNENALQNIFFPTGQVLKEFDLRPREVGILAVTDIRQITKIIDYIIITLDELDEYSLYYSKGSNASICLSRENTTCHVLDNTKGFASQKWLQIHFSFIPMKNANLEYISLNFYVKARVGGAQRPIFKVIVLFDNSHHDGMMPLNLKIDYEPSIFSLPPLKNERDQHWICLFSVIMSLVSLLRGVWKVYNGIFLGIMTKKIFERKFKWKMEFYEKCAFLHLSNIFLIFGCILNILGCYYIIDLRLSRVIDPKKWDFGAVMMSLTYFSSIFHLTTYMERNKPNILLMTIKYSLPKFIRFLAPASCVYFAFVLTAWIVIGISYDMYIQRPTEIRDGLNFILRSWMILRIAND